VTEKEAPEQEKLTFWQRLGIRELRREAGKGPDEPLSPEDWAAAYRADKAFIPRTVHALWKRLPSSPRCGRCGAPFAGPGRFIVRPLGYRPSRKNPTICATCVETSPPGGMKMYTGVLFADLRGFTARTEGSDPEDVSRILRRFYRAAEDVLFPEAVIDKLIGDEVMALYLPEVQRRFEEREVPSLMLEHGLGLLREVGYGSDRGPFVELGIGIDIGEAFVGNIGERALYDFTAVGDVVNTASRLQGEAGGGEILISERVAEGLPEPVGSREEVDLRGKSEPEVAYRIRTAAPSPRPYAT
jgi:adenylate cyclase